MDRTGRERLSGGPRPQRPGAVLQRARSPGPGSRCWPWSASWCRRYASIRRLRPWRCTFPPTATRSSPAPNGAWTTPLSPASNAIRKWIVPGEGPAAFRPTGAILHPRAAAPRMAPMARRPARAASTAASMPSWPPCVPAARLYLAGAHMWASPELQYELRPTLPRRVVFSRRAVGDRHRPAPVPGRPRRGPAPLGADHFRPAGCPPRRSTSRSSRCPTWTTGSLTSRFPAACSFNRRSGFHLASFDEKSPFRPTYSDLATQLVPADRQNRRRFVPQPGGPRPAGDVRRRLAAAAGAGGCDPRPDQGLPPPAGRALRAGGRPRCRRVGPGRDAPLLHARGPDLGLRGQRRGLRLLGADRRAGLARVPDRRADRHAEHRPAAHG